HPARASTVSSAFSLGVRSCSSVRVPFCYKPLASTQPYTLSLHDALPIYSTHKMLAGLSQASQITVQDAENRPLDRNVFNEAYLMHTSTSPQYAIIASCDVAAAMMEPPGGTALVEESICEAMDFRRAMRKVSKEYGEND